MTREFSPVTERQTTSVVVRELAGSTQGNSSSGIVKTPQGTARALVTASASLSAVLALLFAFVTVFGIPSVLTSLSIWSVMVFLIWHGLSNHGHEVFGRANAVTTIRAVSTAILAGVLPIASEIDSSAYLWTIAIIATTTLFLDGLDGYLARKDQQCSDFGARFDLETDAFLALIITVFLWLSGQTGPWVLALGVMRYGFLGASFWLSPLRGKLYPSIRRKTVCVIQVGALCIMLCPWVSSLQATVVGICALVCLSYSFATDILWLFRSHRTVVARHQE